MFSMGAIAHSRDSQAYEKLSPDRVRWRQAFCSGAGQKSLSPGVKTAHDGANGKVCQLPKIYLRNTPKQRKVADF